MVEHEGNSFPALSFKFITDDAVRDVLETHYHQAKAAYEASAWGGTIVLLGSVAEGLLTWALLRPDASNEAYNYYTQRYKGKNKENLELNQWNLSDLIDTAKHLELLGKTAIDAAWAIKEFRNYIHPYRLIGQSARLDQALALTCLGGVSRITDSLRGRIK